MVVLEGPVKVPSSNPLRAGRVLLTSVARVSQRNKHAQVFLCRAVLMLRLQYDSALGRMKLLLLACLTLRLCTAVTLVAPFGLRVSSENFRHVLHWSVDPGSPPGLTYHVYASNRGGLQAEKAVSSGHPGKNTLRCTKAKTKKEVARSTRRGLLTTSFTPDLETNITAPNVTLSGCGTCIRMNISLPKPHPQSRIQDIRNIYQALSFHLSLKKKGQETVTFLETSNLTETIEI
ncbi:hypothetical protein WMY93_001755 [Mugilogobius chulae]|uniref:Fibronectin type-III domain-containing protein n=1 Tax=Mugilogobius chulae TaxID=88201 RepID=A0AAW0Q2R6_9GOBI